MYPILTHFGECVINRANCYEGGGGAAPINQQLAADGQPAVGFMNPAICVQNQTSSYGAGFLDMTSSKSGGFPEVTGHDLETGWGSPNVRESPSGSPAGCGWRRSRYEPAKPGRLPRRTPFRPCRLAILSSTEMEPGAGAVFLVTGMIRCGWTGAHARSQSAAMAAMRWRVLVNDLRSIRGILDLGATGITWILLAVLGLVAGLVLGVAGYTLAKHAEWEFLPIPFWAASLIWLMLPVAAASFQESSDLAILLRFPVRFASYLTLYLIAGLMETSTLVGCLCCLGLGLGIFLARPQLALPLALVLGAFAVFNLLLVRFRRW